MIRNPLQTAFTRTRPDLARVAEGISASLRSFSVAQRLAAANPSDDNGSSSRSSSNSSSSNSNNKPASSPLAPTNNRQRASSAVDNLIYKAEQSVRNLQNPSAAAPGGPGGQNIIRVTSLRGRGRGRGGAFAGPRNPPGPSGVTERPGADYTRRPSPLGMGLNVAGSGGGGGGGRGRGGMSRGGRGGPRRDGGRGGRGGRGRRGAARRGDRGEGRDGADGERQDTRRLDPLFVTDEEAAYVSRLEVGTGKVYDPTFTLDSLHGYAPAVATTSSPFGYAATAVTQARMLSGGQPYNDENHVLPEEALARSTKGHGVLFPSVESRVWTQEFTTAEGVEYKAANAETKQAVLEAALQGKYDAPQAVKLGDTLNLVQNYAKKDTRIFGQPGRTIHDKIKSLLPQQAAAGKAKQAGGDAKKAKA
ncbi:uncharacterized protein B0I36DRAFT_141904 [Microdochium trichocladiopsis]|uniref:Uncharacterized protein n=1 Tax=Microdochium trichocladiopsis TaxID=1682393 RepID=A0A9P9BNF3_9PEZI|nr:uncharacterized protein B0I36DRAFT_141904 [Microdochium trichocladiopsis]KAH7027683.1 hypothetical protein B0I36DRAFT_141904 [Microdochium trichocladiopsis]